MSSILKIEFEKLRKTKSFWAIMLFLVFITSTVAITRSLEVGGSVGGINPAEPRAENGYFFEDNSAYITAEKPIIEYYSENEWAGLNGSYIRSWEENTEGYSVKIVGYEVMEKEKYFSKYDLSGKDQSVADPFAYIMEVTIKIKNEENETGKLQIADWALIGKNDDFIAYLDQQLLMDTDERVDSILSSISTASGKEIEIKLPYPLIYMDKEKEIDRNMPYKIAVTKYPSRKYIQFG